MEAKNMAQLSNEEIVNILKEEFGEKIIRCNEYHGLMSVDVMGQDILPIVSFVRRDERLNFEMFVDLSGVDYLEYQDENIPERFGIHYIFYSFTNQRQFKIRAFVSESECKIETIYYEYKGAIWTEREVYDMYGIVFERHPDLKRILMPEYFEHHPLRKDYPLQGLGERSNFPKYNIYDKMKQD